MRQRVGAVIEAHDDFRIDGTAYVPDLNGVPGESLPALRGLDLLVIDALKRTPHPSHLSLRETLDWISRLNPVRAVITNMHVDMDFDTLTRELPAHVTPAFDGLELEVSRS